MKTQTRKMSFIWFSILTLLFGMYNFAQAAPPKQEPSNLHHQESNTSPPINFGGYGLGDLPSSAEQFPPKLPPKSSSISIQDLPVSVDHSTHMPPVGNQGSQDSCVGWATGYYYKSFHEGLQHGWNLNDTNHQFSPAFIYNQRLNDKCQIDDGMDIGSAMLMLQQKGDVSIAGFPYNEFDTCSQPTLNQLQTAFAYRAANFGNFFINDWNNVGSYNNDLIPLKQELANGNIIVVSIPTYNEFYSLNNFTPPISCAMNVPSPFSANYGGHAIAITGYNDSTQRFKLRNSWGTGWGCNGDAYLTYDFARNYFNEAWWMTDLTTDMPSQVFLPIINQGNSSSQTGIYGHVMQNGVPAQGMFIQLSKWVGNWVWVDQTYTDVTGRYRFSGEALQNNTLYNVKYLNDTRTSGRLWSFSCRSINYIAGTNQHACDFDIADVPLGAPIDQTINLPYTFSWTKRSDFPTDDYVFILYDRSGDKMWWTDPSLGYVNSYFLNNLPSDFTFGDYYWDLGVHTSVGTGWALGANKVTVSSQIETLDLKVKFQDRNNAAGWFQNVPIRVKIKNQAGDQTLFESSWITVTPSNSSDNWGTASVDVSSASLIPGQTYQVFVKGAMHLAKQITTSLTNGQTVDYTDINLNPIGILLSGDINQDNQVGITDMETVLTYWGQTPPADPDPFSIIYRCDLNGDGAINTTDLLVITGSNWGIIGDPY